MGAKEFNAKMMSSKPAELLKRWDGELTPEHLERLTEFYQRGNGLAVDGYAGRNTLASLIPDTELVKFWPMRKLEDGREIQITSGFHTENGSRPGHDGVDFFYRWLNKDPGVFEGHGGAIRVNGDRRWWYPDGALAYAAASGRVMVSEMSRTGYKVWIDHGNGERSGYFHGEDVELVKVGDFVSGGSTAVLVVGDNPRGGYKKHLHFEISPVERYAPRNPRTWLSSATHLDAIRD